MRRMVLAVSATATGLVSLLGLKSYTGHAPVTTVLPAVVAEAPSTRSAPASPSSSGSSSGSRAASPKASPSAVATVASKTVTGDVANFRYGSIQVRTTVTGGKVTRIAVVALNPNDAHSADIDSYAVPQLQQETLGVSSAQIDTVSGATYTSDAYRQSLQSALDKAGR